MNNCKCPNDSDRKPAADWHLGLRAISADAAVGALVDLNRSSLYTIEMIPAPYTAEDLAERLLPGLKHLADGDPEAIVQVEPGWLCTALKPSFERLGLTARIAPDSAVFDSLLGALPAPANPVAAADRPTAGRDPAWENRTSERALPDLPALLDAPGAAPEQAGDLFSAAVDFYRAAPWERLAGDLPIRMEFSPPGIARWIVLIGASGDPDSRSGLLMYENEDDLEDFLSPSPAFADRPGSRMHALTFENRTALPAADLEAIHRYGWEIPGEDALPLPLTLTPGGIERPDDNELLRLEAALRVLVDFSSEQLEVDDAGARLPVEAEYEVVTAAGPIRITLAYPGEAEAPAADAAGDLGLTAEQERAAQIAHSAWQEPDPERRDRLAKEALARWPEAADALMVLAEAAEDPDEAFQLLERAAAAGERLLTPEAAQACGGDFWQVAAARPFLRARLALAEMLEEHGRPQEALEHYLALLEHGSSDPAGARYPALTLLMRLGRDDEALRLLDRYRDDPRPEWRYAEALLAFRRQGDAPEARRLLASAMRANRLAPDYLTGKRPLPSDPETGRQSYEDEEAAEYALRSYPVWWSTPGAVAWLKRVASGEGE